MRFLLVSAVLAIVALISLGGVRSQTGLQLSDFGWERSVSTSAFMRSVDQYYDEIAATARATR